MEERDTKEKEEVEQRLENATVDIFSFDALTLEIIDKPTDVFT